MYKFYTRIWFNQIWPHLTAMFGTPSALPTHTPDMWGSGFKRTLNFGSSSTTTWEREAVNHIVLPFSKVDKRSLLFVIIQQFFESGVVNRLRHQWLQVPQAAFDGDAKLSLSYENVLFPFLGHLLVDLSKIILFHLWKYWVQSNLRLIEINSKCRRFVPRLH